MTKEGPMIKCATVGCKRLVFPGQVLCWKCWLVRRDVLRGVSTQRPPP